MNGKGYAGKQLRLYLDTKQTKIEGLRRDIAAGYLGGTGYAARLLFDEQAHRVDPLGQDSNLIFVMECAEKKLLEPALTDGLDLSWGNVAILPELVLKIAFRQGLGDLLAEGVRAAAGRIGG